jgi:hypothetical protein
MFNHRSGFRGELVKGGLEWKREAG